jgi:hypothetical protein
LPVVEAVYGVVAAAAVELVISVLARYGVVVPETVDQVAPRGVPEPVVLGRVLYLFGEGHAAQTTYTGSALTTFKSSILPDRRYGGIGISGR